MDLTPTTNPLSFSTSSNGSIAMLRTWGGAILGIRGDASNNCIIYSGSYMWRFAQSVQLKLILPQIHPNRV